MRTSRVRMVRVSATDVRPDGALPATLLETRFDLAAIGALAAQRAVHEDPVDVDRTTVQLAPVRLWAKPDEGSAA
ncbi:MAG: hypothetical protein EXR79_10565 [Myxococcales bacterium]|nr:hypothetical protein [Myxococcales bacterium]